MIAKPSFIVYADLDGYLNDPVNGSVNNKIYDTLLEISKPRTGNNRPYPLRQPEEVIFVESYSLMNDFANDPHPEKNFVQRYFLKVRDHLIDTYAAEAVLSVVFVLLSQYDTKKSQRLASAIKRAVDADSAYFKVFEQLANELKQPVEDWQAKYHALQEQYMALSALYQSTIDTPPVTDKHNQFLLSFDRQPNPEETANDGLVQVNALLNAAIDAKTSDIFLVLRYYLAKAKGDVLKMVEVQEEIFNAQTATAFTSNLDFADSLSQLDIIRIFRSFNDAGFVNNRRTGKKATYKELFDVAEKMFNIDLSGASSAFNNSLQESCSEETQTAVFDTMSQAFLNKSVRKSTKINHT